MNSRVDSVELMVRDSGAITCSVCAHHCRLAPGQWGACGVRENVDNELRLLTYGRVVAASLDAIEKKPLRHFRPGSRVYTVATPGCTLACRFCQNWEIALTVRRLRLEAIPFRAPEAVVADALAHGADGMGFSYTEPVASLEYTLDIMRGARQAGLFNVWHTNGYMNTQAGEAAMETFHGTSLLDAACVDLKAATDGEYRRLCGGTLAPVLETARALQAGGVWVEISTPLLAGQNDSDESVIMIARLILETLGPETPWHLLRGHAAYKMDDLSMTTVEQLTHAAESARTAGLRWVYADV